MPDQQRRAPVRETTCQPSQQVDPPVGLAQQQRAAIAGNLDGAKPGFHPARKMSCKCKRFLFTLCHQKGRLPTAETTSQQANSGPPTPIAIETLRVAEAPFGPDDTRLATGLNNLAQL